MIKSIERLIGQKVLSTTPVAGGSVFENLRVETSSEVYFVKSSRSPTSAFREEAVGLRALAETGAVRIPAVHSADDHFLVLEWIDSVEPTSEFWRTFGVALARMHRIPYLEFGFEVNNHIGTTPQTNPRRASKELSWGDYFLEYRLQPMLAHQSLSVESLLQVEFQKARPRVIEILSAVQEAPSLVHGDLWGGNFMCASDGRPVLIDPAPYRGHREVDLAMSELFGGFAPEFYSAYRKEYPLEPGYESRRTVYNLYHLLNHWIIFGASSYRDRAMATMRSI